MNQARRKDEIAIAFSSHLCSVSFLPIEFSPMNEREGFMFILIQLNEYCDSEPS
jgi:hypothetical protein